MTSDQGQDGMELSAADEQMLRDLTKRARPAGRRSSARTGCWELTKTVVEDALEGELDDHLGYAQARPSRRVPLLPNERARTNPPFWTFGGFWAIISWMRVTAL